MYKLSIVSHLFLDRGILMTFGSGANGCLGHGNFNDVSQVSVVITTGMLGRTESGDIFSETHLYTFMLFAGKNS